MTLVAVQLVPGVAKQQATPATNTKFKKKVSKDNMSPKKPGPARDGTNRGRKKGFKFEASPTSGRKYGRKMGTMILDMKTELDELKGFLQAGAQPTVRALEFSEPGPGRGRGKGGNSASTGDEASYSQEAEPTVLQPPPPPSFTMEEMKAMKDIAFEEGKAASARKMVEDFYIKANGSLPKIE